MDQELKKGGICQHIRPPIDNYHTLQFGSFHEIKASLVNLQLLNDCWVLKRLQYCVKFNSRAIVALVVPNSTVPSFSRLFSQKLGPLIPFEDDFLLTGKRQHQVLMATQLFLKLGITITFYRVFKKKQVILLLNTQF